MVFVFALIVGVVLMALPELAYGAPPGDKAVGESTRYHRQTAARQHTGSEKVILYGLTPKDTVSVYVVEGTGKDPVSSKGEPAGMFAGATRGPADNKPLELFVAISESPDGPKAKVSNIFLWNEKGGWQLMDSIIPVPDSQDTRINP